MENFEHQSSQWAIDIDQDNNLEEFLEPAPVCCIYRVPEYLRKINEEAYTPRFISIGPLHHGRKELMGMQSQKRRYLSTFSGRVNPEILQEFKAYIKNQEQLIHAHYSVTSNLQSVEYVAMILGDAVFIIELFLRKYHHIDDFLLKLPLKDSIKKDPLLLENQLPYFVLHELYAKAFPGKDFSFFNLFLNYFFGSGDFPFSVGQLQVQHFTDFYRWLIVKTVVPTEESNEAVQIADLPSASKLNKSGLKFRGIKEKRLLDISFKKRKLYGNWCPWFEVSELQIPQIKIHDSIERLFRNLMALELFHYPTKTHICNYASLMNHLIDTEKDVDLLVEKGIIVNRLGDNEGIANMFNRLCKNIMLSTPSCYSGIVKQMKEHYEYPWNHAKATLKSVYFSNYWAGTATVAAAFLLALTVIQTVCSLMQL